MSIEQMEMTVIGAPLRQFDLPCTQEQRLRGEQLVGKSVVLVFYLRADDGEDRRLLAEFNECNGEFARRGIGLIGVGVERIDRQTRLVEELALRFPLLADGELQLARMFGLTQEHVAERKTVHTLHRATLFLDASLRVVKAHVNFEVPGHARKVLDEAAAHFDRETPRDILQQAPVLLIPNVLPGDLCRRLIARWEAENEESGFMKEVEGKTVGMTDYGHKIRRDHFLKKGAEEDAVKQRLAERVLPEIGKAFNYNVTRREDFRIACYDASRGGYFRPHRDNTTGGTAHRRFAMSLLLNDEYEGGYLRFPEFGMHRYRPAAGGAVVFSCSLLHEATDVTAGRRFVLLSFFYGEAEAKQRELYSQKSGLAYRA